MTVSGDGTWSAAFDTSEIPVNTEFTAVVQDLSDEVDAMIAESVSTETPTEPLTEEQTTTDGQPDFGVAIAIVALLAAALLAIRRD